MSEESPEVIAKRVVEWLYSPEGEAAVKESAKRIEETQALFHSKLTWREWDEILRRPFDI